MIVHRVLVHKSFRRAGVLARAGQVLFWILVAGWTASTVTAAQCAPTEVAKIVSPYASVLDAFGTRLAISSRFLAVSDPADDQLQPDGGAIFVYRREGASPSGWALEDEIRLADWGPLELSNAVLCLSGATLAVGVRESDSLGPAAGAVYVFERTGLAPNPWGLTSELHASDAQHGAFFGHSVAIQNDILVVGAPNARRAGIEVGAAYVFEKSTSASEPWGEVQKLEVDLLTAYGQFGSALAFDGDRVVVGAPSSNLVAFTGGAAFEFSLQGGSWSLQGVFAPVGLAVGDQFGAGLALAHRRLLIGAPGDSSSALNGGAAYLYERTTPGWSAGVKLGSLGVTSPANLGYFNAIAPEAVYCGAPLLDYSGPGSGGVFEYRKDIESGAWYQASLFSGSKSAAFDLVGIVAEAGGVLAAGAAHLNGPGAVHLFESRMVPTVATYCTGTGGALAECVPTLATLGVPTTSFLSTFQISSERVPGGHFGLFLYTTEARATPDLEASGVCLPSGGVRRSGILWSGGTAGACDGVLDLDWNVFGAALAADDPALALPGTTVHGQFVWFEPLGASALTWSDALAFQLCP